MISKLVLYQAEEHSCRGPGGSPASASFSDAAASCRVEASSLPPVVCADKAWHGPCLPELGEVAPALRASRLRFDRGFQCWGMNESGGAEQGLRCHLVRTS